MKLVCGIALELDFQIWLLACPPDINHWGTPASTSTWEAVEHCGFALQFVPEKLRADTEIALKAVRSWG